MTFNVSIVSVESSGKIGLLANTNDLAPGNKIALAKRKKVQIIIGTLPVEGRLGWHYDGFLVNFHDLSELDMRGDNEFMFMGSQYSGDNNDWGPVKEVVTEKLTPYQGVQLAIDTLKHFEAEYSDVSPIIRKLENIYK